MNTLEALREANIARNEEWQNHETPFTLIFWANELAGEAGEACNILKKLDREFVYKVRGSRATLPMLAEELADIIICSDLLGMKANIIYPAHCWQTYNKQDDLTFEGHDYSLYGAMLMANAGRACAISIHYLSHLNSYQLASVMFGLVSETKKTADYLGIDLDKALADKFNATSEKLQLKTRLVLT